MLTEILSLSTRCSAFGGSPLSSVTSIFGFVPETDTRRSSTALSTENYNDI